MLCSYSALISQLFVGLPNQSASWLDIIICYINWMARPRPSKPQGFPSTGWLYTLCPLWSTHTDLPVFPQFRLSLTLTTWASFSQPDKSVLKDREHSYAHLCALYLLQFCYVHTLCPVQLQALAGLLAFQIYAPIVIKHKLHTAQFCCS